MYSHLFIVIRIYEDRYKSARDHIGKKRKTHGLAEKARHYYRKRCAEKAYHRGSAHRLLGYLGVALVGLLYVFRFQLGFITQYYRVLYHQKSRNDIGSREDSCEHPAREIGDVLYDMAEYDICARASAGKHYTYAEPQCYLLLEFFHDILLYPFTFSCCSMPLR